MTCFFFFVPFPELHLDEDRATTGVTARGPEVARKEWLKRLPHQSLCCKSFNISCPMQRERVLAHFALKHISP